MDPTCEGPHCTNAVTQPKTGRRRRFCSPGCRKAAFNVRHNAIVWEPAANPEPFVPEPAAASRPDDAVALAIMEARTIAGSFRNLGQRARPQLAWRCIKTSEAIHGALDDFFQGVDR